MLSSPGLALGQSACSDTGVPTSNLTLSISGEPQGSGGALYLNAEQCADNVAIELEAIDLPEASFLELWIGNDDCTQNEQRQFDTDDTTSNGTAKCEKVVIDDWPMMDVGGMKRFTFSAEELFGGTGEGCTESGAKVISVVPVDSETEFTSTTDNLVGTQSFCARMTVDTSAPGAPVDVSASNGENSLPVTWDTPSSAKDISYQVLVDTSSSVRAGSCSSSDLREGEEAPPAASTLEYLDAEKQTSWTLSGSAIGLSLGDSAAVAVISTDLAGNQSPVSNVACIQRVATEGFWGQYVAAGGDPDVANCSLVGGPHRGGRAVGATLALCLLLGFLLRGRGRRRHARSSRTLLPLILMATLTSVAEARAPDGFEEMETSNYAVGSPERFGIDFRTGPYRPEVDSGSLENTLGGPFDNVFGSDSSWVIGMSLHGLPLEIPHLGRLGVGAGIDWVRYKAKAFEQGTSTRVGETTALTLLPLHVDGVIHLDVLPRQLGIPIVLGGQAGYTGVYWRAKRGDEVEARGFSTGLRLSAQVAMELDYLDPSAARRLDEEWGINHSRVFFEYLWSDAEGESMRVGDDTWQLGLGFTF